MKLRLRRRMAGAIAVAIAVTAIVFAAPVAAGTYTYSSYGIDQGDTAGFPAVGAYNGVYTYFQYQNTNQTGNCTTDPTLGNPVYDQIKVFRSSGADSLFARLVDGGCGLTWWQVGYINSGSSPVVLKQWSAGIASGSWHAMAIWRPWTQCMLNCGPNGGGYIFHFSVDNVDTGMQLSSGSAYTGVQAGIESHAISTQVVPMQRFTSLQYYRPGDEGWWLWSGTDSSYVNTGALCGSWSGQTEWRAASIGGGC